FRMNCRAVSVLSLGAFLCLARFAEAGHELPFYPGYYPQEIRIETVAPVGAAPRLVKSDLHAAIGFDPLSGRKEPVDLRSVESLGGYLVITFNPTSPVYASRQNRCEAARRIAKGFASAPGLYVAHPYPVTPYHPDYLEHADLAQASVKAFEAAATAALNPRMRAKGALAEKVAGSAAKGHESQWDVSVETVSIDDLVGAPRYVGSYAGPPWLKEGWFHAFLLLGSAVGDRAARQTVDDLYQRLATGSYADRAAAANLERALVKELIAGCERVV